MASGSALTGAASLVCLATVRRVGHALCGLFGPIRACRTARRQYLFIIFSFLARLTASTLVRVVGRWPTAIDSGIAFLDRFVPYIYKSFLWYFSPLPLMERRVQLAATPSLCEAYE